MVTYERASKRFIGRLSQTSRALRTYFDAELRSMDLTLARGRLMLHRAEAKHAVSQTELAELLEVEHPTVVRQLDGLEQLGHIERQPLPGDRRAKAIVLTAEGRRIAEHVQHMTDRLSDRLAEGIDPRDLAIAEKVMMQLGDNIARLTPAPAGALQS